jgi:hypothetical protein
MADSVLFIIGASGVGKTAAVTRLCADPEFPGVCHFFDSIGVPTEEEMRRVYGSGEAWQAAATHRWIERIARERAPIAVLEGQARPSVIREAAAVHGLNDWRILLLDCAPEVRTRRLETLRGQPELASERMERWAAYLRGQADALSLPIIDTSDITIEEVVSQMRSHLRELDTRET